MAMRLPRYVYLYFLCQSINLTAAVISVVVAATVGGLVAPDPIYATVPYGTQFLFLLLCTYPIAILMTRKGRKTGFTLGAILLGLSGVCGYLGVVEKSFALLIISHALLGAFTACANFYRFAATDGLNSTLKSRALSLVVAGGVLAGVIGPLISTFLANVDGFALYSLCYGVLIVLAVLNLLLIVALPTMSASSTGEPQPAKSLSRAGQFDRKRVIAAILAAALGYGLMNLLMIQSSMHMNHTGIPFAQSALAIQLHVVAMFLPSLFSGHLISRTGHFPVIIAGFALYAFSFSINLASPGFVGMTASLIVLGLAWNFTYVGGSALLATTVESSANERKWQGLGDTAIAIMATVGAFAPSLLLESIGWDRTNYLTLSVCLVTLFVFSWLFSADRKQSALESSA